MPINVATQVEGKVLHCTTWENFLATLRNALRKVELTDRVRSSYRDFINSQMRAKTTLLLYKSRLFGQNEQTFRIWLQKKKQNKTKQRKNQKEKRGGHIIKCLLTELGQAGRENIWHSVMASGQIISCPALPLSAISTYYHRRFWDHSSFFIIWSYGERTFNGGPSITLASLLNNRLLCNVLTPVLCIHQLH